MVSTVTHGELEITINRSGEKVHLGFKGVCDFEKPGQFLIPILEDLFVENYKEFILAFDDMNFMNSAMLPVIINFIKQLETRKIYGVIIYNRNQEWQAKSFGLLGDFVKSQNFHRVTIRSI